MKKLLRGIVEFRNNLSPTRREQFARLALGQKPDALYIGCSDSRVAVNVFASTDPGDLFVIRNVGNLVPPHLGDQVNSANHSIAAALGFALGTLGVSNIIVCGHSECGAMQAFSKGREKVADPHLKSWLKNAEWDESIAFSPDSNQKLTHHNLLSQRNVLRQLKNLYSYPIVRERVEKKQLRLHGWWFEISQAEVYAFDPISKSFKTIDEAMVSRIEQEGLSVYS